MAADTTTDLVQAYYDSWKDGIASFDRARLREILADDVRFDGPIAGSVTGADRFVKGVQGFVETMRDVRFLHRLQAGDEAAALYDADLPGGTVRFAEFFHVADGRIQAITLLYDAAEYRARGGR